MFTALKYLGIPNYNGVEALIAICIAHSSHLLSVLAVFGLTKAVFSESKDDFAFTAASLHVISPAGIFLSAPFAESSCALLSFTGCLLFSKSLSHREPYTTKHDLLIILSGALFGCATTMRSNGILNGLLLLEEASRILLKLGQTPNSATLRRLVATGLGGMSVGVGFLLPQYIAYSEYCSERIPRPWCERTLPSIYTFVQDHYWYVSRSTRIGSANEFRNVGLFRYWTLSNLPLFLLGAPMFGILILSSIWALTFDPNSIQASRPAGFKAEGKLHGNSQVLRNLAVTQLLLVLLTATTAHVQIITRISSAYPVWLWYVAAASRNKNSLLGRNFVKFMVIYALIQAGLFASFLPPA